MNAVTGAYGYTGKYIARRLLAEGEQVITLTGHPGTPNEFGAKIRAYPFRFDSAEAMAKSLTGVRVLYNTYWIRFDRDDATHERAVANTRVLIRAAEIAGVERIVHISITNPSLESPLPYFRGKALLEAQIAQAKLSYAIIRPTLVFGEEDILINNIAYLLRKMPLFFIAGSGRYRLQPVFADDLARIAVEGGHSAANQVIDAVGPETFTLDELVRLIARAVNSSARILHVSPRLMLMAAYVLGKIFRDVLLTPDELEGLMSNLLVSQSAPTGASKLSAWLENNAATIGSRYASEIGRHYTS